MYQCGIRSGKYNNVYGHTAAHSIDKHVNNSDPELYIGHPYICICMLKGQIPKPIYIIAMVSAAVLDELHI